MNTKTLLAIPVLALGLFPLGLPARAYSAASGTDMGGMAMSQKTKPATVSVTATISPAAPRSGDNALDLLVTDAMGKPVTGLTLTASVAMASMDMGTTHPAFAEKGGGHYAATVALAMDGPWRVVVRNGGTKIAVLDFEAGAKVPWKSPRIQAAPRPLGLPALPPAKAAPRSDTGGSMTGMDMGGISKPEARAKPANGGTAGTNSMAGMAGMDTGGAGMAGMSIGIGDMKTATVPQLQETGTYTATGHENWRQQTGFGRNAPMVGMMNQMMVGGSGAEGMKMAPMKMDFGPANYARPTADEADDSMPGMDKGGTKGTMPGMDAGSGKKADPNVGMDMSGNKTDSLKTDANPPAVTPGAPASDAKPMPGMDMAAPAAGSSAPSASPPLTIAATMAFMPKAGDNPLTIRITDAAGKPVTGAKIATTVTMTSMDMGTTHPAVLEKGAGKYAAAVTFGMAGPWRVVVKVTVPGQKPQIKAFDFTAR